MKKLLPLLTILLFSFSACEEGASEISNDDYMIFGQYAGYCQGDCFVVFKVDAKNLTEDETAQRYTGESYQYTPGRSLEDSAYDNAKALLNEIPGELLSSAIDVYGCPDCADQGGYFLSFSYQGNQKSFRLDTRQTEDQSAEVLSYKEKLRQLIEAIR